MGTVHKDHPTLYRARDLRPGWRLLHYPVASAIADVERESGVVAVRFEDGQVDRWHEDDQVHAMPGELAEG